MSGRAPIGVVLAGGASERMGRDKALIEIGGRPLVARASRRLEVHCDGLLVADRGRGLVAGCRSIADGAGKGPAAGILGAAAVVPGRSLLVLACDLPLVPDGLLNLLAASPTADDWVVPGRESRLEPLCALYQPRALQALERQVQEGVLALHRLTDRADLRIRRIGVTELSALGDPETMFANVNRPDDLDAIRRLLA